MTTALKPISLPTPDGARTPFPEPASKPSKASDDRFRDTLDRRVSDDRAPKDGSADRTDQNDRGEPAVDDRAQETRPGAETAGSERTKGSDDRASETPEPGQDAGAESDRGPEEVVTNDEKVSASDVATRASVDVQAKLSAIAEKALASAEGKAFQVGSTEVFVNPEAGEQGQANATQRGSGSRAQNSGANPASVPQGDTQVTAEGDESTLNLVADGDEASTVPIDRQQSSATSKPTDDAAARAQASAHGTSLQQQTSGGETSSEGDTSGERRGESPALKLVSAERGQASADAQAFTVEASGQNAERSETGQQSAGPRLSVTGESTDRVTQNERAVASAVSRGLSAAVQQRGGSLTLRLTPESLGAVRIDLDLSQGRVSANIHASTEAAQETLAKSIQSLRSSLESKGLAVDRLTVHLTPQTQSGQQTSGDANADDGARDQAQGDRDATGGQSRGRDGERGQGEQHRAFGERFDDAFGLDPKDPRAQTLRLRFSAVG